MFARGRRPPPPLPHADVLARPKRQTPTTLESVGTTEGRHRFPSYGPPIWIGAERPPYKRPQAVSRPSESHHETELTPSTLTHALRPRGRYEPNGPDRRSTLRRSSATSVVYPVTARAGQETVHGVRSPTTVILCVPRVAPGQSWGLRSLTYPNARPPQNRTKGSFLTSDHAHGATRYARRGCATRTLTSRYAQRSSRT